MNEAATKALELVERGVAALGQHAPPVWEKMVTFHLAMTVSEWIVGALVLAGGLWGIRLGCRWLATSTEIKKARDNRYDRDEEIPYEIGGIASIVVGGIAGLGGLIHTIATAAYTFATIWAPEISLILSLVDKAKK